MYIDGADPPGRQNAITVAAAFLTAVCDPAGPDVETLQHLVTPESLPLWGDFQEVAEYLAGCGMTSRANMAVGSDTVAYAKYVTEPAESYQVQGDQVMMARAVASMVWRSALGGWRIHAVGDYLRPEQLPHDGG